MPGFHLPLWMALIYWAWGNTIGRLIHLIKNWWGRNDAI